MNLIAVFRRPTKPPKPNPNDQAIRQNAILLYYHDGAWEQAEVGKVYKAWSPDSRTNVPVQLIWHHGFTEPTKVV